MRGRRLLKILFNLFVLCIVLVIVADFWVSRSTKSQIFTDVSSVPKNKVGLLLGTSKRLANGHMNLYYRYRIDATVALYNAGKIEYVLISGDNGRKEYSEPEDMMADLIAAGIPAERIYLDYAGFRTYDSIVRCREVFGEDNVTIISQPFHNERAIFIANYKDIHAVAFNAQDVSANYSIKVTIREKFARVKMLIDLLFNIDPKFYGPRVEIK
jgi:SanA protein